MPELAEVWLIGFDGADITVAYPSEAAAKAAVEARFAAHWTSKGVTETAWKTFKYETGRRRRHLCSNQHSREPDSNTGWWVRPVPIETEVTDA